MDTFVVRTVLVPCTVVLLGRWNWWPSKLVAEGPEGTDAVGASADALGLRDSAASSLDGDSGTGSGTASETDSRRRP
jgi:RND superfamily putative drug exporter